MPDYNEDFVAPLLRRKAHLKEVGADAAKMAELDHMLRMAGYPADDESFPGSDRVVQEKPGTPRADDEERIMDDEVSQREEAEKRARKVAPRQRASEPASKGTAKQPGPLTAGKDIPR